MALLNIVDRFLKYRKKRNFLQNSTFCGPIGVKSIIIGKRAHCINQTGNKCNISIADHCDIQATLYASGSSAQISIGQYTTIRHDSMIGAAQSIEIGSHVIISNHVRIYDNNNHPTDPDRRVQMCESGFYSPLWGWAYSEIAPVTICDNVWIGEYSTVLKGVTIGEGAIVGCCSVVTKDVEPYTIVAGNPAKCVKHLR